MADEEKEQSEAQKEMSDSADADERQRRSWQSKYQSICEEYTTRVEENENGILGTNSKPTKNPLSVLVGQYDSDSDSEETTAESSVPPPPKEKLNEELNYFMQEIRTLSQEDTATASAPASTSNKNVCASIGTAGQAPLPPSVGTQPPLIIRTPLPHTSGQHHHEKQVTYMEGPTTPWQECYDENSGYVYYWNIETNEVSWDMPPAYQYYFIQHQQWMQQNQMPMIPLQYRLPHMMHNPAIIEAPAMLRRPMIPSKHMMMDLHKNHAKKRKKKKVSKSKHGSDEEKIEMITSYGPTDESDENDREAKKKKKHHPTSFPQVPMGPQLQIKTPKHHLKDKHQLKKKGHPHSISACIASLQQEEKQTNEKVEFEASSGLLSSIPDLGPPGVDDDETTLLPTATNPPFMSASRKESGQTTNLSNLSTSLDVKENLNFVPEKGSHGIGEETNFDQSTFAPGTEVPAESFINGDANLQQSLTGNLDLKTKHVQYQVEEKNNLPNTGIESHTLNEGIQKTVSFALIAGYGEDSDVEDDEDEEKKVEKVETCNDDAEDKQNEDKEDTNNEESIQTEEEENENDKVDEKSFSEHIVNDETDESKNLLVGQQSSSVTESCTTRPCHVATSPLLELESSNHVNETDQVKSVIPETSTELNNTVSTYVTTVETNAAMKQFSSSRSNSGRRGLGFSFCESTSPDAYTSHSSVPVKSNSQKQGNMIQFVKAETLAPSSQVQVVDSTSEEEGHKMSMEDLKESAHFEDMDSSGEETAGGMPTETVKPLSHMQVTDNTVEEAAEKTPVSEEEKECTGITAQIAEMSGVIMEKVSFLAEGKPPISAVQAIGIQVQTLLMAWQHGSLYESYFQQWLADTMEELARLEQGATPIGWQCLWSRGWKRYYYCNTETGEVQWEYPYTSDNELLEEESMRGHDEPGESAHVQPSPGENENAEPDVPHKTSKLKKKKKKKKKLLQENSVHKSHSDRKKGGTKTKDKLTVSDASDKLKPQHTASLNAKQTKRPTATEFEVESLHKEQASSSSGDGTKQPLPPGVDHPELPYLVYGPPPPPPLPPASPPPPPPPSSPPPPPPSSPPPPPTTPPDNTSPPPPPPPSIPPPPPPPLVLPHTLHSPPLLPAQLPLPSISPKGFAAHHPALHSTQRAPSPHHLCPKTQMHLGSHSHMVHGPYLPTCHHHTMTMYERIPEEYTDIDGEEMKEDNESHPTSVMQQPQMYMSGDGYVSNRRIHTGRHVSNYGKYPYSMNPVTHSSHVIIRPPEKTSLHAQIHSFYSDLATIEEKTAGAQEENVIPGTTAPVLFPVHEPIAVAHSSFQFTNVNDNYGPATNQKSAPSQHESKASESPVEVRKKKKPKLAPGLTLKKKNVTSMVAKWQKLQDEVRRSYKKLEEDVDK